MTTIDLYRKHKAGEISREKFLYEVRRNEQLPWITNLTSYDDAVKILKNKGVVTEAKIEEVFALTPAEESTLEKIVAKHIEDADAISKEMDAYYENGFLGFSDMLQSNLKRDSEYTSWTQRTNDEEQFRKEIGESLNEDWGSSDQSTFNQSIHKDLREPKEMPMPFDPKFEAAVASAVDFWWDDWDEYRKDRDGLIDEAKRRYLRSYFPEDFKMLTQMFSEALNEGKKDNKAKKETKTKTVDYVNPYEYRHGLTYELEQADDYSADGLEKAIDKVLKNLTKDITFYSTLLNQKQSSFEFKPSQTDAKGMQANADGTLKKGAGKLEKANVKDNLGKKEAGKSNPKGVKVMPDKGVTGTQKTIKEGLLNEEAEDNFMDSILDILVNDNILTQDDIDKLNNGEYPELLNALYAEFDKYKDYEEADLSISTSDLNTSAKHIAQKLGKINEGLEVKKSKYISSEEQEDEDFPVLNDDAIRAYLKSVIDPEYIDDVDVFMDDDEGYGESSMYFFDTPDDKDPFTIPDNEVERWAEQEMSYYLTSRPDEFPYKSIKEELDVNFEENNETQFEDLMKKYDWYYEMSDDSSKFNAGRSIDKQLQNLGGKIGGNKAVEIFNKYAPADRKVTSTFFTINENEDKKAKLKELLKKALKEVDPQLQKLSKDEENAERSLAGILQKKAAILSKPGTQG